MNIVILAGDQVRHRYFAQRIAQTHTVSGAVLEKKEDRRIDRSGLTPPELESVEWWERARDAADEKFFSAGAQEFDRRHLPTLTVETRHINDENVCAWVRERSPDLLVVFGTGLIKEPYLSAFSGRILNIHLGLSPYYRGSATNLWPILNRELEYIGTTVLFLDPGIDSGDIIHQGRPHITADDDPHTIGAKAIVIAADLMIKAIHEFQAGTAARVPQQADVGRVYYRKNWGVPQIQLMHRLVTQEGVIAVYSRAPDSKTVVIVP